MRAFLVQELETGVSVGVIIELMMILKPWTLVRSIKGMILLIQQGMVSTIPRRYRSHLMILDRMA